MLRRKSPKIISCVIVCAFAACIAMGQGTAPKTVRVKITTREKAPDVLKRLNQAGAAQNLEFVNDESRYTYWIEYDV